MLVARRTILRELVAFCDAITLLISYFIACWVVGFVLHRKFVSAEEYQWLLALIVPAWLICLRSFGLYRSAAYDSKRGLLACLLRTQFFAGLLLLSAMYLTRSVGISRLMLQIFLAVSFALLVAQKFALRAWFIYIRQHTQFHRRRILLISAFTPAERYLNLVREHVSMLSDVVGILTPGATNSQIGASTLPPLLGTPEDLPVVLQARVVDEVVVASALSTAVLEQLTHWCSTRGVPIRILVEVPHPLLGVWSLDHLDRGQFLLSLVTIPQNAHHLALKRCLDVMAAILGLLACGLAYLRYGLQLRRETGASVIFRQQRVGENGRRFTLYKFRTMCAGAEQIKAGLGAKNEMKGPIFKVKDDPRVTPTGRKLRRRHLDELPQFWNVLKGEMSLVGTRPPTDDETAAYLEHHRRRLSIKPGLTGLWQLNGNGGVKDFDDVVKLDCEYIDNWSLWLDAKIVAKTVTKVMRGDGW
jgi:exopolysaccharide biosynthesis polyprenyl glycosylphosphotransferase